MTIKKERKNLVQFMREKYESLALAELKEIAKARGMKRISGLKKAAGMWNPSRYSAV